MSHKHTKTIRLRIDALLHEQITAHAHRQGITVTCMLNTAIQQHIRRLQKQKIETCTF